MSCNCACGRPKDCDSPFCEICLIDFEKKGDEVEVDSESKCDPKKE